MGRKIQTTLVASQNHSILILKINIKDIFAVWKIFFI